MTELSYLNTNKLLSATMLATALFTIHPLPTTSQKDKYFSGYTAHNASLTPTVDEVLRPITTGTTSYSSLVQSKIVSAEVQLSMKEYQVEDIPMTYDWIKNVDTSSWL